MDTEKKREFIINFAYYGILCGIVVLFLKFGMPLLAPFVIGFVIAYIVKKPARWLARRFKINRKISGMLMVLLFYCTIGLLISLLGVKIVSTVKDLMLDLPWLYTSKVEPFLNQLFDNAENTVIQMDQTLMFALEELERQFVQSLGNMVSSLSVGVVSQISDIASSLPGLFVKMLLMIISSFFIAADFEKIVGFCVRQMGEKAEHVCRQVEEYIVGTLFVCIRSYIIIMMLTFVELSIGLSILKVDNAMVIAAIIAIFDILPVLGTGGIIIPWAVISLIQGNIFLGCGLLILYVAITIIRNIVEPKIVGSQLGLHPVVTLASMFVGLQVFGGLGLFGMPITLSLLKHLNDNGTIHILRNEK